MRLVLRQGLRLTVLGVGLGVIGAFGMTRVISNLLVGVAPTDPATFATVAVALVGIGLVGSYVPARKALRVSATEALKAD